MRNTIFLNGKRTSESSVAGNKNIAWVQSQPLECYNQWYILGIATILLQA